MKIQKKDIRIIYTEIQGKTYVKTETTLVDGDDPLTLESCAFEKEDLEEGLKTEEYRGMDVEDFLLKELNDYVEKNPKLEIWMEKWRNEKQLGVS